MLDYRHSLAFHMASGDRGGSHACLADTLLTGLSPCKVYVCRCLPIEATLVGSPLQLDLRAVICVVQLRFPLLGLKVCITLHTQPKLLFNSLISCLRTCSVAL